MEPIFCRMIFITHYNHSRGGWGWSELAESRQIRRDELTEGASFDLRDWAHKAKPGEYRWFGVEKFLSRIA